MKKVSRSIPPDEISIPPTRATVPIPSLSMVHDEVTNDAVVNSAVVAQCSTAFIFSVTPLR